MSKMKNGIPSVQVSEMVKSVDEVGVNMITDLKN